MIITLFILLFIELGSENTIYERFRKEILFILETLQAVLLMSISAFVFLKSGIHFILSMFNKDVSDDMPMMTFDSPIGISVYLVIQMLLGYFYRDF